MFECSSCKRTFDEPAIEYTTYEKYYGVDLGSHTRLSLCVCPYCGADEIGEIENEYEEE